MDDYDKAVNILATFDRLAAILKVRTPKEMDAKIDALLRERAFLRSRIRELEEAVRQ